MWAVITTYSWEELAQASIHNSLEEAVETMMKEYQAELQSDRDNHYRSEGSTGEFSAQITNYRASGDVDVTTWLIGQVS